MIRFASRLAGAALSRLNRVRPLSNRGVSGEFRYLGSPPQNAAAERNAPARAGRGSGTSGGRGSGHRARCSSSGWIRRPASTSLSLPNGFSAALSLPRESGAKPKPNCASVAAREAALLQIGAAAAPSMPPSCSANQARPPPSPRRAPPRARPAPAARGSGAGTSIPAASASSLTASMKAKAALVGQPADRVAMRAGSRSNGRSPSRR